MPQHSAPFGIIKHQPIRVGYIRVTDCAPFVVAEAFGIFKNFDLDVRLSREVGWASVRDKTIFGELDATQALGPMPFAATLGLGSTQCDCISGLVLNLHGNAITLSADLAKRGVTDVASLSDEIFRSRDEKTYTFGVVFPYSSHHYLLRQWLKSGGIKPGKDAEIVMVPPSQMVRNLAAGTIDGYCVGEPWNSFAIEEGVGWTVEVGAKLSPGHPEKVLMVRKDFADYRAEIHTQLTAALLEACRVCQDPHNHSEIAALLSKKEYLNCPAHFIESGFSGMYRFSDDKVEEIKNLNVFHGESCNEPCREKAYWILDGMEEAGHLDGHRLQSTRLATKVFRPEIYEAARDLYSQINKSPSG